MAHSLSRSVHTPDGRFTHRLSGTKFIINPAGDTLQITMSRDGVSVTNAAAYVIGSGSHAYGFLTRVGSYLFQAPVSYYVQRAAWDVAPGYEEDPAPDFARPATAECLQCHSGRPQPVTGTLNRYQSPEFSGEAISCDRCHGDLAEHLRHPGRQNIVNPVRLSTRARDSVCEQCHLSGETRVLNPGREWSDFHAGQELEDVFSVFVRQGVRDGSIKVVSHVEQLALSTCARNSSGKLWCGTCHDPHQQPERPVRHYRERCLSCHGDAIMRTHAKPADNCIECHMPRRNAKDGAHTVFTDHRIARVPVNGPQAYAPVTKVVAWREPRGALALRNLGLANIEIGERDRSAEQLEEGARQVVEAMKLFPPDPVMLTKVGLVLLRTGDTAEAVEVFEHALKLDPNRAGSHVNLGNAYKEADLREKAISELERAIELDPSLENAYRALGEIYEHANDQERARGTLKRYLQFMPNSMTARKALIGAGPR